jgi:chitin disaccharide deacetylase
VLIVNADDVGASPTATDPAIAAFEAGLISSCSAMVWMPDSLRAAELARERGLPIGLHLNLTLPFAATDVPSEVRDRQARLIEYFENASWRDDIDAQPPRKLLRQAVADQLDQFAATYRDRTHLDGHHHVHVHRVVLGVLPRGMVMRPILREPARADARLDRRERRLHRRFRAPRLTLAFEHLHPALGGVGLDLVDRARGDVLEVMVHPQQPRQLEALQSPEWRAVLARVPVGAFTALSRPT